MRHPRLAALAAGVLFAALSVPASSVAAAPVELQENASYLIVLKNGVSSEAAQQLVTQAGGTITSDLTEQIGVVVAESEIVGFDTVLNQSRQVELAAENLRFKGMPGTQDHPGEPVPGGGPDESTDTLEALQWDMRQIRAPEAHAIQAGSRLVDVGILDSGITASHPDFTDTDGNNVDCVRGRDFVAVGPGIGNPDPCLDNQYHGTHVAGTVAARANGIGVVGVAPNVTLVPIKVCDAEGYCYASSVIEGITYAGDIQLDVINMSFYVDDNEFHESTEFKCNTDPAQRAIRHAVERAIQYARNQGVTPVAALGNSDVDLAHPQNDRPGVTNACEVVPAETQGVIGTMATGPGQEKAFYSNYGVGATDVAAPGGNSRSEYGATPGACGVQIPSTFSPSGWVCIQGTSMAAPHTAGVAALIISQYGTVGADGDVKMPPQKVEAYLQGTTVDIGQRGYDECFGHGRIDALRAVTHDTSDEFMVTPPCPEYSE